MEKYHKTSTQLDTCHLVFTVRFAQYLHIFTGPICLATCSPPLLLVFTKTSPRESSLFFCPIHFFAGLWTILAAQRAQISSVPLWCEELGQIPSVFFLEFYHLAISVCLT